MTHQGAERGFTLAEAVAATALTLVIFSALLTALDALRRLARDETERLELEANGRAGVEALSRDLHRAGFGLVNDRWAGRFGVVFPNAEASDAWTTDAITLWSGAGPRAVIVRAMPATSRELVVDQVAGFAEGDLCLVAGPGPDGEVRRDRFVVTAVQDNPGAGEKHLQLAPPANPDPLSTSYQPGSLVAALRQVCWRIGSDGEGRTVLLRREGNGPEVAVAENLISLGFGYRDGSDPAVTLSGIDTASKRRAIRAVTIDLRLRTELPSRVTHAHRTLVRTAIVSPRNLGGVGP